MFQSRVIFASQQIPALAPALSSGARGGEVAPKVSIVRPQNSTKFHWIGKEP